MCTEVDMCRDVSNVKMFRQIIQILQLLIAYTNVKKSYSIELELHTSEVYVETIQLTVNKSIVRCMAPSFFCMNALVL